MARSASKYRAGPFRFFTDKPSPGGLVNYVSKRPTFDPFREIKFEAGTYDRFQGELDVGGALDERKTLAYRVTGLVRDSETQVDFIKDNRIYVAGTDLETQRRYDADLFKSLPKG